jgi:hypothetical protein
MSTNYPNRSTDYKPDTNPKRAMLLTFVCGVVAMPINAKALYLLHGCSVSYITDNGVRRLCDTPHNSEVIAGFLMLLTVIIIASFIGYKAGGFRHDLQALLVMAALSLVSIGLFSFPLIFFF